MAGQVTNRGCGGHNEAISRCVAARRVPGYKWRPLISKDCSGGGLKALPLPPPPCVYPPSVIRPALMDIHCYRGAPQGKEESKGVIVFLPSPQAQLIFLGGVSSF